MSTEDKFQTVRLWRSVVDAVDQEAARRARAAAEGEEGAVVSRSRVIELAMQALAEKVQREETQRKVARAGRESWATGFKGKPETDE